MFLGAVITLINQQETEGNLPFNAVLYFIVPSAIIYAGFRLFQKES